MNVFLRNNKYRKCQQKSSRVKTERKPSDIRILKNGNEWERMEVESKEVEFDFENSQKLRLCQETNQ